jgi:hypothetical protein
MTTKVSLMDHLHFASGRVKAPPDEWVTYCTQCPCGLTTVTVNVQAAVLPPESVAVQVTVVAPIGKQKPDAAEQTTVGVPGQLSLTPVGAG